MNARAASWRRAAGIALAAGALAVALAVVLAGCGADDAPAAEPAAAWVGAAACARCHAAEHAAWSGSDHDRAMQRADESTVLGDFDDASFTHFGVTSTFFRRDGGYFVRTDGQDGAMHELRVAYTFGVDPLQQYLIELPGGHLQALSVCWDTRPRAEGGQRWFHLYPGERIPHGDPLHWTGRNQSWNAMCADCHSTNLRKGYDAAQDRYATTWSEIDVACEACHGPGSRHVALAEAVAAGGATRPPREGLLVDLGGERDAAWVLAPGAATAHRVPPRRSQAQIESCAPCHSRRTPLVDGPRPAERFLDTHRPALLDEGLYEADGQILEEVYVWGSFVQSKMFHAGVTCTDCHDPHTLQLLAPGNTLCARCHSAAVFDTPSHHHHAAGTPGAACVDCHMPSRAYMVVDPRRDHGLRVPRPDLSSKLGTPNACNGCHGERSAAWAAEHVAEWFGPERRPHYGEALHAGRRGAPGSGRLLAALASDPAQPAIARATALTLLPRAPDAPPADLLRSALRDGEALVRHAALMLLDGAEPRLRLALALPLLADPVRLVRAEAARVLVPAAGELEPPARTAFERARDEWLAAQQAQADWPWAHVNLALYHLERGEPARAESEYLQALRLAPWSVEASVNLADLYRTQGRDAEGERVLRAALAHLPEAADLHHVLGMLLVRQKRTGEALAELERAARLRPDEPRFAYAYGLALDAVDAPDRALAVLEDAHRRHPGNREILVALATRHRERGDREAALRFARALVALAPDPAAQQLLEEIEREPR